MQLDGRADNAVHLRRDHEDLLAGIRNHLQAEKARLQGELVGHDLADREVPRVRTGQVPRNREACQEASACPRVTRSRVCRRERQANTRAVLKVCQASPESRRRKRPPTDRAVRRGDLARDLESGRSECKNVHSADAHVPAKGAKQPRRSAFAELYTVVVVLVREQGCDVRPRVDSNVRAIGRHRTHTHKPGVGEVASLKTLADGEPAQIATNLDVACLAKRAAREPQPRRDKSGERDASRIAREDAASKGECAVGAPEVAVDVQARSAGRGRPKLGRAGREFARDRDRARGLDIRAEPHHVVLARVRQTGRSDLELGVVRRRVVNAPVIVVVEPDAVGGQSRVGAKRRRTRGHGPGERTGRAGERAREDDVACRVAVERSRTSEIP